MATATTSSAAGSAPDTVRGAGTSRTDVTGYLTLWLVLLFGITAQQVLGPLGAIGSPAMIVAIPAGLWWFASRAAPSLGGYRGPSLIRVALLLYAWYLCLSFAVALARPLTGLELTGAVRALITTFALTGIGLLVTDGISRVDRLITLLRRVVWGGAFMAAVGIAQFVTGRSLQPAIPGLVRNTDYLGLEARSIFHRPAGTAMHPIEFGVMAAALLPLAIHFALYLRPGRQRQAATLAAALLALGVPMSVSRSGVVAVFAAMMVLFLGWSWRRRLNGMVVTLAAVPVLWMSVPGLVGTIRSLFTWADSDPSLLARQERVPRIMALIRERPVMGLGNGTWSVEDYFLIDNEAYVTTLETGVVGLALTVALFAIALYTALAVAHAPHTTEELTHLGRVIAAGLTGIGLSMLTFDAFHYRILTGVLFVFIGASGALLRFASRPPDRFPV